MGVTITSPAFGVNVKSFGAKGDGSTDDTAAFQAAINAARGGKLFIPQPSAYYKITDTLTITPASGTQVHMDIEALGPNGMIRFSAPNKPLFRSYGWKHSIVSGVKVDLQNAALNAICWDVDADGTYTSTSNLIWRNCLVGFGTGGNGIGWRIGATGGNRDFSVLKWDTCQAIGQGRTYGDIGWQNMSQNGLAWEFSNPGWSGIFCGYCDTGVAVLLNGGIDASVTTIPVNDLGDYPLPPLPSAGVIQIDSEKILYTGKSAGNLTGCTRGYASTTPATHADGAVASQFVGSNRPAGGGSHTWTNCVVSGGDRDFIFANGGSYTIVGGRFETGYKLIFQNGGTARVNIAVVGAYLVDYTPADEQVIRLQHPGVLNLDITATRPGGSIYTAAFTTFNFSSSYWLRYKLSGAIFGPNPAHTVSSGNVAYTPEAVILNSSNQPTGVFT